MTLLEQIRQMRYYSLRDNIYIKTFGMEPKMYEALKKECETITRYSDQLEHIDDYIEVYGIRIEPYEKR
jgi:hypothetical protein